MPDWFWQVDVPTPEQTDHVSRRGRIVGQLLLPRAVIILFMWGCSLAPRFRFARRLDGFFLGVMTRLSRRPFFCQTSSKVIAFSWPAQRFEGRGLARGPCVGVCAHLVLLHRVKGKAGEPQRALRLRDTQTVEKKLPFLFLLGRLLFGGFLFGGFLLSGFLLGRLLFRSSFLLGGLFLGRLFLGRFLSGLFLDGLLLCYSFLCCLFSHGNSSFQEPHWWMSSRCYRAIGLFHPQDPNPFRLTNSDEPSVCFNFESLQGSSSNVESAMQGMH